MRGGWQRRMLALMAAPMLFLVACGGSNTLSSNLGAQTVMGGTGITNSVSHPSEMEVGDIMPIDFEGETNKSIDFTGVDTSSEFVLVVGSASSDGSNGTLMQLSYDQSGIDPSLSDDKQPLDDPDAGDHAQSELGLDISDTEVFHQMLRDQEDDLAFEFPPVFATSSSSESLTAKSMVLKSVSEGENKTFQVLSSISGSSTTDIQATARCVGTYVVLYIDDEISSSMLSEDEIDGLCGLYDDVTKVEFDLIGKTSDVNGDGKVSVLITLQINRFSNYLGGGIVTGYFYARDLYYDNEQEIVYILAPDPDGSYGTAISKKMWMQLAHAVYPHELQHAISYNQHVFVHGGAAEVSSVNEWMSHLIEDVTGYGMENPSRYNLFLASPSSTKLLPSSSPGLLERGAGYLFLRFLYEQSSDGNAFLRRLMQTANTGVENFEAAFAGTDGGFDQFSEFFGRWTVAIALSNQGITNDSRYVYRARTRHSVTGNWEGVCLVCNADDGRGTVLTGVQLSSYSGFHLASVSASAAKYYKMSMIPPQLVLQGSTKGNSFGILMRTE